MCDAHRRQFLGRLGISGLLLTPLAAALSGCRKNAWPEDMVEIKWDRDTCARCSMVISDRRFAGEIRGGPDNTVFKFDDPGCLAFWLRKKRTNTLGSPILLRISGSLTSIAKAARK